MKTIALSERAILVKLSVSLFEGKKKDKKLITEVADNHDATASHFSVWKKTLASDELNAVVNAAQKLRLDVIAKSLVWQDGGARLIPSEKFIQYKQDWDKLITEFYATVDKFIAAYPRIIHDKQTALGDTFNAGDYVKASELREKYKARITFEPVAVVSSDWRIAGIDAQTAKDIAAQVEQETAQRLQAGKAELLGRLREAIAHLYGKLADGKGFKVNSVRNVIEAAETVAALNITGDADLTKLSDTIGRAFAAIDAETIRENKKAHATATDICKQSVIAVEQAMEGLF